jgi:hypothetical protein
MSAEQKKAELDDECCICGGEYDPECGGVQGYFGISPVTFCEWCYSSVMDMAKYHLGIKDKE